MNITLFIGSISGGGAERVACELCSYLSKRHDVTLLTVTNTKKNYFLDPLVSVKSLDYRSAKKTPKIIRKVVKMIRLFFYLLANKKDLLIVFLPETIKALMFFKPIIHCPIILSERNNPESYDKRTMKSMFNLFQKSDGIVFQTEYVRNIYSKKCKGLPNSVIIPNAINQETLSYMAIPKTREKKIVSVGRLSYQKNFELLIKAFSLISDKYPDYILEIYGQGEEENMLKNLIGKLRLQTKVFLKGYVGNIALHIKNASLFVLSSRFEGIPNSLIEAMALGIPSISTKCLGGGPETLIIDHENGLLVESENVELLSKSMDELLCDCTLSNRISRNSLEITQKLSPTKIYAKWMDFINSYEQKN